MQEPSWYHVFNSTTQKWLCDDEKIGISSPANRSWGPYSKAAEFHEYETARNVGRRVAAEVEGTVIILADHGQVTD